jgi:hypothetical protein
VTDDSAVEVDLDETHTHTPTPVVAPTDTPAPPAAEPSAGTSLLDEIVEGVEDATDDTQPLELPVGKIHRRLYARYQVLPDEEVDEINRHFRNMAEKRKKVRGRKRSDEIDSEVENERSAMLLARACDTLLWLGDDGEYQPLDEVLRAAGVEVPDGPLRYSRTVARLFKVDVGEDATASEVALQLHRWGKGYAPVRSYANALNGWMSGARLDAIEAAFEGN